MENVKDWCISRQLVQGHRIPAWFFREGEEEYVVARTEAEALEQARVQDGQRSVGDGRPASGRGRHGRRVQLVDLADSGV